MSSAPLKWHAGNKRDVLHTPSERPYLREQVVVSEAVEKAAEGKCHCILNLKNGSVKSRSETIMER